VRRQGNGADSGAGRSGKSVGRVSSSWWTNHLFKGVQTKMVWHGRTRVETSRVDVDTVQTLTQEQRAAFF
jgi:hypothetical protein